MVYKTPIIKQEGKFLDKGFGIKFWDMTPKIQGTNANQKVGCIKLKSFCSTGEKITK